MKTPFRRNKYFNFDDTNEIFNRKLLTPKEIAEMVVKTEKSASKIKNAEADGKIKTTAIENYIVGAAAIGFVIGIFTGKKAQYTIIGAMAGTLGYYGMEKFNKIKEKRDKKNEERKQNTSKSDGTK